MPFPKTELDASSSSMISALKGQSGPILVGVVSWTFATLQKHQFETRQAEVASIAEKIRVLYGPLRGNRLGESVLPERPYMLYELL